MAKKINWFPGLKNVAPGSIGGALTGGTPMGPTPDWFAPLAGRSPYGGGGGGGNPYAGLLNEYLGQQKAAFAAQGAADAASRDAALRRYVISYGQVPDFDQLGISKDARGFWQKAIDDKTKALALKNEQEGTSIHARLEKANADALRRIPAQLAARGALHSGQTGWDLKEQGQAHKIQGFDTLNEMLQGVEGTVGQFLQAERERQMALAEAEMQARMAAQGDWGGDMYGDGGGGGYEDALLAWIRSQTAGAKGPKRPRVIYRRPPRGGSGGGPYRSM